jgi:hypothetical protein
VAAVRRIPAAVAAEAEAELLTAAAVVAADRIAAVIAEFAMLQDGSKQT